MIVLLCRLLRRFIYILEQHLLDFVVNQFCPGYNALASAYNYNDCRRIGSECPILSHRVPIVANAARPIGSGRTADGRYEKK